MSNFDDLINFCKNNDESHKIICTPKGFIDLMQSIDCRYGIEEAIFLAQLVFWSDKGKRSDGFFYKSDKDWEKELGFTTYKLNRMRKKFCEIGYLEVKIKKANGAPTHHYLVRIEKIMYDLSVLLQTEKSNEADRGIHERSQNKYLKTKNIDSFESQNSDNSELQDTDNSLTEDIQKIQHTLGQEPLVNTVFFIDDENDVHKEKKEALVNRLFKEIISWVKDIFPKEILEEKNIETICSVAKNVNFYTKESPMYSKEIPDHKYIIEKLLWAASTARKDRSFTLKNLISAIRNPENLKKYHQYHDRNKWKSNNRFEPPSFLDLLLIDNRDYKWD